MMFDRLGHGWMLAVPYAVLFGCPLHDPGQGSIVSVAHKRAQMMDDVVVEPTNKPTDERVRGRVVGGCREDVINPVVELASVRGEVSAVDRVCGLEYEGYAQSDNQVGQQER